MEYGYQSNHMHVLRVIVVAKFQLRSQVNTGVDS